MVLPPSKRRKAPKMAWTRCPSHFSIPPSATSCTHRLTCRFGRCFCTLCRGLHRRPAPFTREAKKVCLIPGSSKSVSFLGRGEMNGVFIINFVKFIQTRNFFRRGALQPLYRQSKTGKQLSLPVYFTLTYIIVLNNILYIIIYNIEICGKQTVFRLFIEQIYCFSA